MTTEYNIYDAADAQTKVYIDQLRAKNLRMKEALLRISRWHGEFPKAHRMEGLVAYGSNVERDYMRRVASDALEK